MTTRRLICAMKRPRPARWLQRRHAVLAGLVGVDIMLVGISSVYSYHELAFYLAAGLALLAWSVTRRASVAAAPED